MNLRSTLNNLIGNRYLKPADPAGSEGLIGLKQIYDVVVDGRRFAVELSQQEILPNLDGSSPNGGNYLRLLIYKIFQSYNTIRVSEDPSYRSPVVFSETNLLQSRGLFAELPNEPVFSNQEVEQAPVLAENPLAERDGMGRNTEVLIPQLPQEETSVEPAPEVFTGFTSLPASFKVLQRNAIYLDSGVAGPELTLTPVGDPPLNADGTPTSADAGGLNQDQRAAARGLVRADSGNNFFLSFPQFCYAFENLDSGNANQAGEAVGTHTVTLISRHTDFAVTRDPGNEMVTNSFQPNFLFSFFENSTQFDRVYVNSEYLAAGLEADVLRHVRYCHSKLIMYNTLRLTTYEKKLWGGVTQSIAQKSPLKPIGSKDITFRASVSGTNPNLDVNVNANLMFTSSFESS